MTDRQELEQRRAALSPEQLALLENRLHGTLLTRPARSTIPRRGVGKPIPLSFSQQRLWFLDQLIPQNAFYNEQTIMPIRFAVDSRILEATLNEIVRRHEILRTRFMLAEDEPVQVIEPGLKVPLNCVDLRHLAGQAQQLEAQNLARRDALHIFDLTQCPLLLVTLLRLAEAEYLLVFTVHHIIYDGWSNRVFERELREIYPAFASGSAHGLPELQIQYADFAVWQRELLQGAALERLLDFWRRQLAAVQALQLPTDYPRPPMPSFKGAHAVFNVAGEVAGALKALSLKRRTTMFVTMLAAFAILLQRYCNQDEIVIGTPSANRGGASELEYLIGFFVNTLVLRVDTSGNPSFVQLLDRVHEMTLNAQEHQELPFEKLVEELQPQRDLSRNPLVHVAFQLLNHPTALATGDATPLVALNDASKFDLRLDIHEALDGIAGILEYSTDLFAAPTIDQMIGNLQTLLAAIAADPDAPIRSLEILSAADRQRLEQWNNLEQPYPEVYLHQWVESYAAQTPDQAALVFGGRSLSYRELNRRANQLAHYLIAKRLAPEALIGMYIERSPEAIIGLLAIMKAGYAYVPLDPAYPAERLQFMIADSALQLVLTNSSATLAGVEIFNLAQEWPQLAPYPDQDPQLTLTNQRLAYLIYTSGSTGKPKGVLIEHGGLANVAQAQKDLFALNSADRVLQFSSLNFDASLYEMLLAFASGATLFIGTREELLPGPALAEFLARHEISAAILTPSTLSALPQEPLPALRLLSAAGEVCPAHLAAAWMPGRRFFNLYGPTEATIWASCYHCQPGDHNLPIGYPIANTQLYVLDDYHNQVPIGVVGELYIGGVGVGRGYLNRPDLEAERFSNVTLINHAGRLYRTGDLVRYRGDGALEILGRNDRQVKLRGLRIELGEIEAVIAQHPLVREVVVEPWGEGAEEKLLVAYLVAPELEALSGEPLRALLRQQLPEYMVPGRFIFIQQLPFNANGKLDRQALPKPEKPLARHSFRPPQSRIELTVAAVWCEVLGVDQVGLDDNFFDLGGHSLLLAQVHARLKALLDTDLSLVDLFQYPTINLLAQRLGSARSKGAATPARPQTLRGIAERAEKQKEAQQRRRRA